MRLIGIVFKPKNMDASSSVFHFSMQRIHVFKSPESRILSIFRKKNSMPHIHFYLISCRFQFKLITEVNVSRDYFWFTSRKRVLFFSLFWNCGTRLGLEVQIYSLLLWDGWLPRKMECSCRQTLKMTRYIWQRPFCQILWYIKEVFIS